MAIHAQILARENASRHAPVSPAWSILESQDQREQMRTGQRSASAARLEARHPREPCTCPGAGTHSARRTSAREEVGNVEGELALGEVERVVAERVDEVAHQWVDFRVVGDRHDG